MVNAAASRDSSTHSSGSPTAASLHQKSHNPVVASLTKRAPHPYSAVSLSPTRQHAAISHNDKLQILAVSPKGLELMQTIPFPSHVTASATTSGGGTTPQARNSTTGFRGPFQRPLRISEDLFHVPGSRTATNNPGGAANSMINVVINDVAWSDHLVETTTTSSAAAPSVSSLHHRPQSPSTLPQSQQQQQQQHQQQSSQNYRNSECFLAAAGSNGSIAIWKASNLLDKQGQKTPDVVLHQHSRAVNRLAWHPTRQLLLSASHDATVRLWERRLNKASGIGNNSTNKKGGDAYNMPSGSFQFPLFGPRSSSKSNAQQKNSGEPSGNYTWQCTGVFEPRSEAVRDVAWNPNAQDLFALCTSNGSLIVYNRFVRAKYVLKVSAHDRDATSLDWHPTQQNVVATGGSSDRLVKVWNLQSSLGVEQANASDAHMAQNQNTASSRGSTHTEAFSDHSDSSHSRTSAVLTMGSGNANLSRQKADHVLSVTASVKRVKWRPPAISANNAHDYEHIYSSTNENEGEHNPHESMLVVATAPVKGETGAGAGMISLFSYHRPFMPLSVVEGHKEGAVVDFVWLDTPKAISAKEHPISGGSLPWTPRIPFESSMTNLSESNQQSAIGERGGKPMDAGLWQHILSVGKDGRCLVQSLVRGRRPILQVPSSTFAMANLSPYQQGYGSLQIFSVCQDVGGLKGSDTWLTSLRRDHVTAAAPGIFKEEPLVTDRGRFAMESPTIERPVHCRIPQTSPTITFNVVDQGDLDGMGRPANYSDPQIVVSPEVVHLSRFASSYIFYPTLELPTRVHLCLHNSQVSRDLQNEILAHMWQMLAVLLENAGLDGLAEAHKDPNNIMQFALIPTIHAILEERANDGDVQSCVALCETLQLVNKDESTQIPDLEIQLVREWYLSYVDLLRDMCLFSHACAVIRNCNDPFISALNTKSTTISESCPNCGKALLNDGTTNESNHMGVARRYCKSCRRRVGKCFLCHEPVKGMYVWCPGCGHGGHLEHALSWFGGLAGGAIREECPTGCGHRCNLLQTVKAFPPDTDSPTGL